MAVRFEISRESPFSAGCGHATGQCALPRVLFAVSALYYPVIIRDFYIFLMLFFPCWGGYILLAQWPGLSLLVNQEIFLKEGSVALFKREEMGQALDYMWPD